jgi:hypothetical protein
MIFVVFIIRVLSIDVAGQPHTGHHRSRFCRNKSYWDAENARQPDLFMWAVRSYRVLLVAVERASFSFTLLLRGVAEAALHCAYRAIVIYQYDPSKLARYLFRDGG